MAIKSSSRVLTNDGKVELSLEEFKKWLKKFCDDRDGGRGINTAVLREAIRASGGRFCRWKARRIVKAVDTNSNGVIDDSEIDKLVMFAEKQFGLKIIDY